MIRSKNFACWPHPEINTSVSPKANLLLTTLAELLKGDILWEPYTDRWTRIEVISEMPEGHLIVHVGTGKVGSGWSQRDYEDLKLRLEFPADRLLFYYENFLDRVVELELDQREFLEFFERRWGGRREGRRGP